MKKINLSNGILILMLVAGLSLLLYPSFADYWNSFHQSKAVSDYVETVMNIDDEKYEEIWSAARQFNEELTKRRNIYHLPQSMQLEYEENLNIGGNGIMAYLEIPDIKVHLPIYHGTDDAVLQIAIGHLEWSSLPVGGESTHCVVSGHRGLPSARLFTDLDNMEIGDLFVLYVLDEKLTYMVDQIKIVEPQEIEDLGIVEGEDYCTLVTCTPYGVNSHRMLVRGTRVDNVEEARVVRVAADAVRVDSLLVASMLVVPFAMIGIVVMLTMDSMTRKRKNKKTNLK